MGIIVPGVTDVLVRLAKCCTPVPGDAIVGYISLGRGITIHREDCPNVKALKRSPERFTPVSWDGAATSKSFRVQIAVDSWDRPRLLEDVARTFAEHGANIVSYGGTVEDQLAKNWYTVEVGDVKGLRTLLDVAAQPRRGVRRVPRHAVLTIHPSAAAGFASAADVYERARPSYPQDAIDWLVAQTGLGPGRTVVDLGAGTGKLTRLLLPTGARVVAVEPIPEMRAHIEGRRGAGRHGRGDPAARRLGRRRHGRAGVALVRPRPGAAGDPPRAA